MQSPGRLPLAGDRWTALVRTLTFEGIDLTGATFAMQVRLKPDTPGAPLVNLSTVTTASAEGVRLISVTGSGAEAVSVIGIRINETTMEGLPAADEIGNDATFAWDIHITPAGGIKEKYLGGPFVVRGGVTGVTAGGPPGPFDEVDPVLLAGPTGASLIGKAGGGTVQQALDALSAPRPYRLSFFFTTAPTASEVLFLHVFADAVSFADEWAGSAGAIEGKPDIDCVMSVQKNGAAVGTITISAAGAVGFSTTGPAGVDFAAGDVLKVVAPATPPTAMSNGAITLKGTEA